MSAKSGNNSPHHKVVKIQIERVEGKHCGVKYEFDTIHKANIHIANWAATYPKEGYDKHSFTILFDGDDNSYTGKLCCMHPENELFNITSNDLYAHMIGSLTEEIKVAHSDQYRQEVIEFRAFIEKVYEREISSLTQTESFTYRGLSIRRNIFSVTQSLYTISSADGNVSIGPFCGEAPYNQEALCHCQTDGRKSVWQKTDDEIRSGVDALLSNGNRFGNGKLVDKIMPFVTDKSGLMLTAPEALV